jgi:hypothetical protein
MELIGTSMKKRLRRLLLAMVSLPLAATAACGPTGHPHATPHSTAITADPAVAVP